MSGSDPSKRQTDAMRATDLLCDEFEAACKAGSDPRIEDFLTRSSAENRDQLLRELLFLEWDYRRLQGRSWTIDDYRKRFASDRAVVDAAYGEVVKTDPSEVITQFTGEPSSSPESPSASPPAAATSFDFAKLRQTLSEIGLVSPAEFDELWTGRKPDAGPVDAATATSWLVKQGKLTDFQAKAIVQGRGDSLALGEYLLLEQIGAGGMGQVFKARHRRMQRIVALKVISQAALNDAGAIKRFQREVVAAARLEHPNIVAAYDAGQARGTHFLVMQFIDGEDLSSVVRRSGPLAVEKAVDCVVQAARGLAYAHAHGVIHRDIKPANLLLDKSGTVKILDMGLARFDDGADGLTGTEQVMGTVDYMSPEQAANTKGADARADVYSLGCTLWYLLTGQKTYGGDTMISRLMAHRDAPLPSLVKERDDVSWPLEQIFHKLIAKRPQDRLQTMDEVIAALEPYAGDSSKGRIGVLGEAATSPEMAAFLQTIGPKPKVSQTALKASAVAPHTDVPPVDATLNLAAADVGTDPKSELLTKAVSQAGTKPKMQSAVRKRIRPPIKLIAVGIGSTALLLLLGIWIVVRDKDGNETARVPLPTGGSVAIFEQPLDGSKSKTRPAASSPTRVTAATAANSEYTADYALEFDGKSSHVQVPTLKFDGSHPITIEFRYRASQRVDSRSNSGLAGWNGVFWVYQSTDRGISVFGARSRDDRVVAKDRSGTPPKFKFQQIAAVWDGREIRYYCDGMLVDSKPLAAIRRLGAESSWVDFVIAGSGSINNHSSYELCEGVFDELRVSKSARYFGASYNRQSRLLADADTLALYYFDEGVGDVLHDSSGNGHVGKIVGAKWVRADGAAASPQPTGFALDLSARLGQGMAKASLPEFLKLDAPLTVELVVTPRSVAEGEAKNRKLWQFQFLELKQYGDRWEWLSNAYGADGKRTPALMSGDALQPGNRVHLAGVSTGTQLRLFVDGKLVGSRSLAKWPDLLPYPTHALGGRHENSKEFSPFDGVVHEVRISTKARYDKDFKPTARLEADQDTAALYRCDEGAGDVLHDSSGNGRDGKIVGAKWCRVDALMPLRAGDGAVEVAGTAVDVLSLIEPTVHSRNGRWEMQNGALQSPGGEFSNLTLPVPSSGTYRIGATVERLDGADGLGFQIQVGSNEAFLLLEGYPQDLSGLSLVDGKTLFEQAAIHKGPLFTTGKATELVVDVTPTSVKAVCDGKTVIDWRGDAKRLSIHPDHLSNYKASPGAIALGTHQSRFRFTKLTYTPAAN